MLFYKILHIGSAMQIQNVLSCLSAFRREYKHISSIRCISCNVTDFPRSLRWQPAVVEIEFSERELHVKKLLLVYQS